MSELKEIPNLCKTIAKSKKSLIKISSILDSIYTETRDEFKKAEIEFAKKKKTVNQSIVVDIAMERIMHKMSVIDKSAKYTRKEKDTILDVLSDALDVMEGENDL